MDAPTLIARLREAGMTCRTADGKLYVDPVASLVGELRRLVVANKAALITWLADEPAREAQADAIFREAVQHDPFAATDAAFGLRETALVLVSRPGEPPKYAALDPDYWRDLCQWAKESRSANARRPPARPRKVKK